MNERRESALPIPTSTQRDSDGRLVSVAIDCGRSWAAAAAHDNWLVAVDGSKQSLRAVSQAVNLARGLHHGTVHLVNVQPWLGKEAAESELLSRGWEATATARSLLDASDAVWRLHVIMGDAAERIVELSSKLGCGGIVIGSHGLGATHALLLGSVAYKVIHLSKISVLVVR
jgi:nucleotide-binding universal stress UspA family protein